MSDFDWNWLLWLWPISGWFFAFASLPKWVWTDQRWGMDAFGFFVCIVCGAVVGPIGVFWFWLLRKNGT